MKAVAAAACLSLLALPILGQEPSGKGVNFYSVQREIEYGRQIAAALESTLPIVHEPRLDAYLARLAATLAPLADPRFPYSFTLYEDRGQWQPVPVALAMPADALWGKAGEPVAIAGGPVFIPMSLLAGAPTEAEFVFQLAHAMAHIGLRQPSRMATRDTLLRLAGAPVSVQGGPVLISVDPSLITNAAAALMARQFELQADAAAARMLADADYDPAPIIREFQAQGTAGGGGYSVHPSGSRRAAAVQSALENLPARTYPADSAEFTAARSLASGVGRIL